MDATDVESAYLSGKARYERWKQEFALNWFKPYFKQSLDLAALYIDELPEPVKAALRQANPRAMGNVEKAAKEVLP